MNFKQIGLALATLGTGMTLGACKKNKDATEVPGSSGRDKEGGCGGKASGESSCGGKKGKDEEGGCGAQAKKKAGEHELALDENAIDLDNIDVAAQGPEESASEPVERSATVEPTGPTDKPVEAMSDTHPLKEAKGMKPKKKRRKKRGRAKKKKASSAEEVCGEGTCG